MYASGEVILTNERMTMTRLDEARSDQSRSSEAVELKASNGWRSLRPSDRVSARYAEATASIGLACVDICLTPAPVTAWSMAQSGQLKTAPGYHRCGSGSMMRLAG